MQSREENNINVLMHINDYLTKEEREIYNNALTLKDIPSKHKAIMLREKRARYLKAIEQLNGLAKIHSNKDAAKNWNENYKHFAFQTVPQLIMISKILEELKITRPDIYNQYNDSLCEAMLARLKLIATEGHDDVVYQSMVEFKVKKNFIEKFQKVCPLRNSFPENSVSPHQKNTPVHLLNTYISNHGTQEQKKRLNNMSPEGVPVTNGGEYFIMTSDNSKPSIESSWLRFSDQLTKIDSTTDTEELNLLNEQEENYILNLCEAKPSEQRLTISSSQASTLLGEIKKIFLPVKFNLFNFLPNVNILSELLFSPPPKKAARKEILAITNGKGNDSVEIDPATPVNPSSHGTKAEIISFEEFTHYYRNHINYGFFHRHGQNGKNNATECLKKFNEYRKIHINPIYALKDVMSENHSGNYYHHSFKTYLLAYHQYLSQGDSKPKTPYDFLAELQKKSPYEIKKMYFDITLPTLNKMTSEHYLAMKM